MKTPANPILLIALLLFSSRGWACECAPEPGVSEREAVLRKFQSSELVAVAEVTEIERGSAILGRSTEGRLVHFYLRHVFKGPQASPNEVVAYIEGDVGMCQVRIEEKELWLLYTSVGSPVPLAFCSYSGTLLGNLRDLRYLYEFAETMPGGKANCAIKPIAEQALCSE